MENNAPLSWDDLGELFAESKGMARGLLARDRGSSLQATELVLTALGRLRNKDQSWSDVQWVNRQYFFGALHSSMQRALIDHARRRNALKRKDEVRLDSEQFALILERYDVMASVDQEPEIVEALLSCLEELKDEQPDWVEMINHRFFSGLTLEETAQMMDVSSKTIQRWWQRARLVLHERVREALES